VLLVGDSDHDLVEVPLVARARQPSTDLVGERLTELEAPLPYRFVAHDDAAGGQHLLDHAQAEHHPNAIDKARFTVAVPFACWPLAKSRRSRPPSPR
jgi:hypothetical protein